jgi:hypothetical protein
MTPPPQPPRSWLWLILLCLITFGLSLGVLYLGTMARH